MSWTQGRIPRWYRPPGTAGRRPRDLPGCSDGCHPLVIRLDEVEQLIGGELAVVVTLADLSQHSGMGQDLEALQGPLADSGKITVKANGSIDALASLGRQTSDIGMASYAGTVPKRLVRPIRNSDGSLLLESFLVAAVVSVLGIRWFLTLTGFPKVGRAMAGLMALPRSELQA